jgi:hypothetical protein
MIPRLLLSSLFAVSCALAQQQLQLVALPAGTVYEPGQSIDFGAVPTTAPETLTFELNNTGPDDAVLTKLWVDGAAFTLGRNPAGLTLSVGQTLQFTIAFAPLTAGPARLGELWIQIVTPASSPSPALQPQAEYDLVGSGADPAIAPRAATPTPTPAPAQQLQLAASLPAGTPYAPGQTIAFGTVQAGSVPLIQTFSLTNNGPDVARLTNLAVDGTAFTLTQCGEVPEVMPVNGPPCQFTIIFAPSTAGQAMGQLEVQIATQAPSSPSFTSQPQVEYPLAGTGTAAPTPTPTPTPNPTPTPTPTPTPAWPSASIVADPSVLASDQQATISIKFDSPLQTDGAGTFTVEHTGGGDTQRGFVDAAGTLVPSKVSFTLTAGETMAEFEGSPAILFQTGTTASTLTFTATLGDGTRIASSPFTIAPAAVGIDLVLLEQAVTSTVNGVQVSVQGFDNTQPRSASLVSFTFYDTAGEVIGQPISVDATTQFASYFAPSGQGAGTGAFYFAQGFNVTGDVADIGSVKVSIQNSVGPSAAVVSQ